MVQKTSCQIGLMVQDSAMTFENLPFCCPKSTCSLFRRLNQLGPYLQTDLRKYSLVIYELLLFIGKVLILSGLQDTYLF